jgi:hypothetical protein
MTESAPSALQLRQVGIDTYRENVAYLHRDCQIYRSAGFQALAKVEVQATAARRKSRRFSTSSMTRDRHPGAAGA